MNKIEWRQLTVYFQIVENELKTTIWTYDQKNIIPVMFCPLIRSRYAAPQ